MRFLRNVHPSPPGGLSPGASDGFTLAELLIALVVLGVISSLSIAKIAQADRNTRYTAMTKEAMATIAEAYMAYKRDYVPSTSTDARDLRTYINRVTSPASGTIQPVGGTAFNCSSSNCAQLHNGGIMGFYSAAFPSTDNNAAIMFLFDPDGTGAEVGIRFFLYFNGRITDRANVLPGTVTGYGTHNPDPTDVPSWYS